MDRPSRFLQQLADARCGAVRAARPVARIGHPPLDAALGGGLARGHLHELFAAHEQDGGATVGLGAILAQRIGGPILWLREGRAERRIRLHAPGFAELGVDPSDLLLGVLTDADAVLRAAADALRCPGLGVVVIELWKNPRNLGLTATRRFQLAAEASGVTALMLRIDAEPAPSAASTRWSVRSFPSRPLEANAPGYPAFELELLRRRGGGRGCWRLEWDRDAGRFRELGPSALAGVVVPAFADRPAAPVIPLRQTG